MYIKVYSYHVRPDKVEKYIKIQQMADSIYSEYVEKTTLHLNCIEDSTKWTEIHQYASEEAYQQAMEKINAHLAINELYEAFREVLIKDSEITEENYRLIDI
ncbi:hypothetical protein ACFOZY_10825 [Chungangia koreensis]|uniref:ABM domain-containing protein n=1 Tax=Chungangia koreensis TaxID=752657 RepID=A0ABV8X664_9LACT